jgi:hypothetical protein
MSLFALEKSPVKQDPAPDSKNKNWAAAFANRNKTAPGDSKAQRY